MWMDANLLSKQDTLDVIDQSDIGSIHSPEARQIGQYVIGLPRRCLLALRRLEVWPLAQVSLSKI